MDILHSSIIDDDPMFMIDPNTREIIPNGRKTTIGQYDHNSERITFGIPARIEGHNMAEATIEIHYINISKSRNITNANVYEVNDKTTIYAKSEKAIVKFSWLVSRNATQLDGTLDFAIRFLCTDPTDGSVIYEWHTKTLSDIDIFKTLNNGAASVAEYSDILEEWRQKLMTGDVTKEDITNKVDSTDAITDASKNYPSVKYLDDKLDEKITISEITDKSKNIVALKNTTYSVNNVTVKVKDNHVAIIGTPSKATNIPLTLSSDSILECQQDVKYIASIQNVVATDTSSKYANLYLWGEYSADSTAENPKFQQISFKNTNPSAVAINTTEKRKLSIVLKLPAVELNREFDLQIENGTVKSKFIPPRIKNYVSISNITPASFFGAMGDGVTDDTDALQNAIDFCIANKRALLLSGGATYIVSKPLKILGAHIFFDGKGAKIKVADNVGVCNNTTLKCVLEVDNLSGLESSSHSRYALRSITNLTVDCNGGRAVYGIYVDNGGKTAYRDIMIMNPEFCGIRMMNGNEAALNNIHCNQSDVEYQTIRSSYRDSVGVYLSCSDNYVENCISVDFVRGFATGGTDNHFSKCHAWNAIDINKMKNSISFDVLSGYSTYTQCTVDSTKYGFYFHKQEYNTESARACIIGGASAYNSVYETNFSELGSPVLFNFADEHTLKGKAVSVISSMFKPKSGLNCKFDNLTDSDNKITVDRLIPHFDNTNNLVNWDSIHVINFENALENIMAKLSKL